MSGCFLLKHGVVLQYNTHSHSTTVNVTSVLTSDWTVRMPTLLIVALTTLHAAPWWVKVSMPMGQTDTRPITCQISFKWKKFLWTDGRKYERTDQWTDILRPALLCRLCRRVDLINRFPCWKASYTTRRACLLWKSCRNVISFFIIIFTA